MTLIKQKPSGFKIPVDLLTLDDNMREWVKLTRRGKTRMWTFHCVSGHLFGYSANENIPREPQGPALSSWHQQQSQPVSVSLHMKIHQLLASARSLALHRAPITTEWPQSASAQPQCWATGPASPPPPNMYTPLRFTIYELVWPQNMCFKVFINFIFLLDILNSFF